MTDCDGRGAHVAGIIAANNTDVIEVAPQGEATTWKHVCLHKKVGLCVAFERTDRSHPLAVWSIATLGAYRVFGCRGGTSNGIIMKALLRAAGDGMQLINLSLGGPGAWRQDREAPIGRLANQEWNHHSRCNG
jgi:subtilisin family serine protease